MKENSQALDDIDPFTVQEQSFRTTENSRGLGNRKSKFSLWYSISCLIILFIIVGYSLLRYPPSGGYYSDFNPAGFTIAFIILPLLVVFTIYSFLRAAIETDSPTIESWERRRRKRPIVITTFFIAWIIILIVSVIAMSAPEGFGGILIFVIGSGVIVGWLLIYHALYMDTERRMEKK